MAEFRTIVVPTDFSPMADQAVTYATQFAAQTGGAIVLLHVFDREGLVKSLDPAGRLRTFVGDELEEIAEGAGQLLEKTANRLREKGLTVDTRMVEGHPAGQIVETAADVNADAIIMGTHGYSGFKRLLLGSVAQRVLRQARCPVVTVAPRSAQEVAQAES